jgi:amino acid adenylation domain-containing protein
MMIAPALLTPYAGFAMAARETPQACALEIGSDRWTYRQVHELSGRIAQLIGRIAPAFSKGERVGVLASRSLVAYVGSMAVFSAGGVHVALNPAYPPERNATIIRKAGIKSIITGPEGVGLVEELARMTGIELHLIAPCSTIETGTIAVAQVLDSRDLELCAEANGVEFAGDDLAYIVFTSGSTGEPKGVAITHGNLAVYMQNFRALAAPVASDRVVSTYELTFDVALHDLLNAWWSGASLIVMPERAMMAPARFILDKQITYWFSVASFAMILQRQGLLRPGLFPLLRVSLLCGEALPKATAMAWSQATPNSVLYNVYGPTETTMELAFYRWEAGKSELDCLRGVTPIGVPFADHAHLLLDDGGNVVVGAGIGELYLQGPQVGLGYWGDEAHTNNTFTTVQGQQGRWYRTGDRIERDSMGLYHFVSRIDFMVKVRGHRIELGDIENALRQSSGVDLVAAIPLPGKDGMSQGIVAFVCADQSVSARQIREGVSNLLPKYMVPDEIRIIADMPMNANRKVDRSALGALIDR